MRYLACLATPCRAKDGAVGPGTDLICDFVFFVRVVVSSFLHLEVPKSPPLVLVDLIYTDSHDCVDGFLPRLLLVGAAGMLLLVVGVVAGDFEQEQQQQQPRQRS
jgi:hypothetical protein